jgi:putative hydrolase of the HAD superfamily
MKKVIFWDFDGTLVPFTSWRMAIVDVLNECEPGNRIDPESIRPFLRDGFPWHYPENPHPHLKYPDKWWKALEPVFIKCYKGVGYPEYRARELAEQVRKQMTRPQRYVLYENTILVLETLKEKDWRNVILSNHMPELPEIVNAIGLSSYVDYCITSAATGWEKPNPRAFRNALAIAGNPEIAWMVGDNTNSDVLGAEAAGIPAILVHASPVQQVRYYAADLPGALKIILDNDPQVAET